MKYTVRISGKAWESQSFGSDEAALQSDQYDDVPDLRDMFRAAKVIKCGRGVQVELTGSADTLEHLAEWLHSDGEVWRDQCGPEDQPEAKACLEAAKRIREVIQ